MDHLSAFLSANQAQAYSFAQENTKRNSDGRIVIAKNDEWREEKEWEELYASCKRKENTNVSCR